jgi:hypothetical protein
VAQTSVCDVCDMLMPLEAEVQSFHAPAAAFLRPQSSSLRGHQHPAGRDCHLLLWPSDGANPTQIVQRLEERTAQFILKNLRNCQS